MRADFAEWGSVWYNGWTYWNKAGKAVDNLVDYMIEKHVGGVVMMEPLERSGSVMMREKIWSGEPVYYDGLRKMVENDPRWLPDLKEIVEDGVDGHDYLVDDEEDINDPGGTYGRFVGYAKELRKSINRSMRFAYSEMDELGWAEDDERRLKVRTFEKQLDGLDEIIDTRRSGIINFVDNAGSTGIKGLSEELRKLWLLDVVFGGVLRRELQFREFERWYAEMVLDDLGSEDSERRKEHFEWREKKWKAAHGSLHRALKAEAGKTATPGE